MNVYVDVISVISKRNYWPLEADLSLCDLWMLLLLNLAHDSGTLWLWYRNEWRVIQR